MNSSKQNSAKKLIQITLSGNKTVTLAPKKFYTTPSTSYEKFVNHYCSLKEYLQLAKDYSELKKQCDKSWREEFKGQKESLEIFFLKKDSELQSTSEPFLKHQDNILSNTQNSNQNNPQNELKRKAENGIIVERPLKRPKLTLSYFEDPTLILINCDIRNLLTYFSNNINDFKSPNSQDYYSIFVDIKDFCKDFLSKFSDFCLQKQKYEDLSTFSKNKSSLSDKLIEIKTEVGLYFN